MSRIRTIKTVIWRFIALHLRRMVQRRTASALARLDDRALAVIGVPRDRIADYACELARTAVTVPPKPASDGTRLRLQRDPLHPCRGLTPGRRQGEARA
jgi:uncharacterized protein YjiS (DUF1127 family)